jgi:archaellum component FlaC
MEPAHVAAAIKDLRDFTEFSLNKMSREIGEHFTGVEGRLTGVEGRLAGVERRLGRLETRVEDLETTVKEGFVEVRERLAALEHPSPR